MALYMTQKMSSGVLTAINYYRKQTQDHPSHTESGAFTTAATADYAATTGVALGAVIPGTYKSGQGVPTGGTTKLI